MDNENIQIDSRSYDIDNKIINLTTTTLVRLFSLHNDAVLLYMFYIKTAKIQQYNPIYANAKFCQKGLGWGKDRFFAAKKILKDEKLISNEIRRDSEGKIEGNFIKIKYYQLDDTSVLPDRTPVETGHPLQPDSGCQPTNTIYKKGNTIDKKSNTNNEKINAGLMSEAAIRLFSEWKEHKKLSQYRKVTKELTKSINDVVQKAIDLTSEPELIQAIRNYSKIISNPDKYWFNYKWKFTDFLGRGVTKQGISGSNGFWKFLDDSDPFSNFSRKGFSSDSPKDFFTRVRTETQFYLHKWESGRVLDKNKQTYMGMDLDTIQTRDFNEYLHDLKHRHEKDSLTELGHYQWIEEGIIGNLFNKDKEMLEEYLKLYEIYRKRFKKVLAKYV